MSGDLDPRLLDPFSLSPADLMQISREHTTYLADGKHCVACGWVPTKREPRCRSAVIADALAAGRKPKWHGDEPASEPKPARRRPTTTEPALFELGATS